MTIKNKTLGRNNVFCTALLIALIPFLSACVSREQADAKLAKGCEAAAKAFLDESYEIKQVLKANFSDDPTGTGYRHVELQVVESDGWDNSQSTYTCIFQEDFGVANSSHSAAIYQLKMHDKIYGLEGREIIGTMEDHTKLTDAVNGAMR